MKDHRAAVERFLLKQQTSKSGLFYIAAVKQRHIFMKTKGLFLNDRDVTLSFECFY